MLMLHISAVYSFLKSWCAVPVPVIVVQMSKRSKPKHTSPFSFKAPQGLRPHSRVPRRPPSILSHLLHFLRPPPLLPNLTQAPPRLLRPHLQHHTLGLIRLPPLPAAQARRRHSARQILLDRTLAVDLEAAVVFGAIDGVAEFHVGAVGLQLEDPGFGC